MVTEEELKKMKKDLHKRIDEGRAIEAVGIAFSVLIIIVSFMIIYLFIRFGIWPL